MKEKDIRLGGVYQARVSGKMARVRIDTVSEYGGWFGTNLETGHSVRVRTAGRLRKPAEIVPPTSRADFWKQWHALKSGNPDTILLFQVGEGDFEAYGDDATVCSTVLGMEIGGRRDVLTSGHCTDTPMAGFPSSDLETNIRRLVAAGHRVAVCDRVQMGDDRKPVETIVV